MLYQTCGINNKESSVQKLKGVKSEVRNMTRNPGSN